MKALFRNAAGAALTLSLGAVAFGQHYSQTNLVSNTSGVAPVTDPNLRNPWGLARNSSGAWWAADNNAGVSTLYNGAGVKNPLVVTIPPADPNNKQTPIGTPTGTFFNGSLTDFVLPQGVPAQFLFATLDGSIAAWNPKVGAADGPTNQSTHAMTVVKTTDGSVYTGLTSAFIGDHRYMYAANFAKGRVDVYDNAFHRVDLRKSDKEKGFDPFSLIGDILSNNSEPFEDNLLPRDYKPFNVQAIGNDIVVTYALETPGPGLGYVDIYSSDGHLLRRLEHGDFMNAPWGVALAPTDFGRFSHHLLVAQFADGGNTENAGVIAAFDLATGKFEGLVEDASGKPLSIQGIWSISPGNVAPANSDPAAAPAQQLYFTAVQNGDGGLFGYLTPVSTELVEGNGQ
jgi:uncharacterized protein (TIGR03118 family)